MIILIVDHCYRQNNMVDRSSLNRFLFFSDLIWFLRTGKTISEVTYKKEEYGPTPINMRKVRSDLLTLSLLKEEMYNRYGYPNYLYTPSLSVSIEKVEIMLSPDKVGVIRLVSNRFGGLKNATMLFSASHRYGPWKSANWHDNLDFRNAKTDLELLDWLELEGLLTQLSSDKKETK